jgi:hypothetical protein
MAVTQPQKSRKLKTSPAAPPPTQELGQTSHAGPGAGTPIAQPQPVSQPAQGADVYNQSMSSNIAADINRRAGDSVGGFQSSIAGMDLGGQFAPRGTAPSTAQTFATAAQSGAGSGGFVNLGTPQRAVVPGASPTAPLLSRIDQPNGTPGQAPSKVEQAADQASDAIGPAPRVDMGLADRRLGEYQESLGMSREVIDRLLNGPSTSERLGGQVLRSQLALARSARGGPGAVQQALSQAQQQAPEMQAMATEQARQEELSKLTAAGNVASNFAQAALGARGQDVNIAGKNVDSGLQVKDMVTRLTGVQLELDQRNTEMIGQMARDLAALQFDWASLSAQQASAALDRYLQIYGIDANYRAQIKAIEAAGKITSKDILNGIIGVVGSGAAVGAAAAGKPG